MKPHINSVEVHPQLSNNGHPVDGALVRAGSPARTSAPTWMDGALMGFSFLSLFHPRLIFFFFALSRP